MDFYMKRPKSLDSTMKPQEKYYPDMSKQQDYELMYDRDRMDAKEKLYNIKRNKYDYKKVTEEKKNKRLGIHAASAKY
jgi:hypothetical protein